MNNWQSPPAHAFSFPVEVPDSAIDANGHVNNVAYIQWMQEAAVRHYQATPAVRLYPPDKYTWVVRRHTVEYFAPAFSGERLTVSTWVAGFRRVRSQRRYAITRESDARPLVCGETDWIFLDLATGRPAAVPRDLVGIFIPNR